MAAVYFICGFIGSGKTTYSKKLEEAKGAFRFTIDEWMIPLYGEHMEREVFDSRLETLASLFKDSVLRLIELGVPVIFDFGFWKQRDRELARLWAERYSLEYEIIYLDVDFEVCCKRAYSRNDIREDKAYEMTPEMLKMFWLWFEAPSSDEEGVRFISVSD